MKRFLLFLNSLLFVCAIGLCANDIDSTDVNNQLQRYAFQIETDKAFVSGLLLANESEDVINGSMINEFGVSAIDFTYSKRKQKVKLLNVVSFLNKWYIRMVLKNDLKFCLHILYGTPFNKNALWYAFAVSFLAPPKSFLKIFLKTCNQSAVLCILIGRI